MSSSGKGTESVSVNNSSVPTVIQGAVSGLAIPATSVSATSSTFDAQTPHSIVSMWSTLSFSVAPTSISWQLQASNNNIDWANIGTAITSVTAGVNVIGSTGIAARYWRVVLTISGGTGVSATSSLVIQ